MKRAPWISGSDVRPPYTVIDSLSYVKLVCRTESQCPDYLLILESKGRRQLESHNNHAAEHPLHVPRFPQCGGLRLPKSTIAASLSFASFSSTETSLIAFQLHYAQIAARRMHKFRDGLEQRKQASYLLITTKTAKLISLQASSGSTNEPEDFTGSDNIHDDGFRVTQKQGSTESMPSKLMLKIDARILPMITVIYVLAFLDR